MNNGLYLMLVWSLIPLAIVIIAVFGRPVLMLPHRLVKRLSVEQVYTRSVVMLALVSIVLLGYLTLQFAFSTGGKTFPPAELRQFNLRTLYLFLFLFGVPLTVLGLVTKGRRFLAWPHRLSFGLLSEEGAYAIGVAGLITLGVVAEALLAFRLALA
ncbi:MAG: hypothetical protein AAB217_20925 [Chloroflexota bacterium]